MKLKLVKLPIVLLSLAGLLGGCATAPPDAAPNVTQYFEDAAFGAPLSRVDVADVFALSPAMKRYLDEDIAQQLRTLGRQRGLAEALYSKAQLRLEFDAEVTRTAAQAFDARAGNCLALVVMTAALAKHLELPVHYNALIGQESWSRSGGLSVVSGHVNITIDRRLIDRVAGVDPEVQLRLDFGALPRGRGASLRPVSEATILAMFLNNRAAEALVRGEMADAYANAREAVLQDPAFASAYNTLGVIYQRRGLAARAEQAYRRALALEGGDRVALVNLVGLLDSQGRAAESAPLQARLAQLEANPPFREFDQGWAAAQVGDFRAARDHILREMNRDPEYHEFHFWLAVALYGLGDVDKAREHLTIAINNSTTRSERAIYASKLARLAPTANVH